MMGHRIPSIFVPKLCLGTPVPKLCFASKRRRETEFPTRAFPNRVWERGVQISKAKTPLGGETTVDPTDHGGVQFQLARPSGSVAVRRASGAGGEAAPARTLVLLASRGSPSGIHALHGRDSCC